MVHKLKCECSTKKECELNTLHKLNEFENFFLTNMESGTFVEEMPKIPYYTFNKVKWYADNWYRCTICGCLWEYVKPDFPASGFVRKFVDGSYFERGY